MTLPEIKKKVRELFHKKQQLEGWSISLGEEELICNFFDFHLEKAYKAGGNSLFDEVFIEKPQ